MSGRNVANIITFNDILLNNLEIQNSGTGGLIIYSSDPANPEFSFIPSTGSLILNGDLTVTGDAVFDNITVTEYDAGLLALGATNTVSDVIDIGIWGRYQDSGIKYCGLIRDADDSLQRWTFFDNITTLPTTTVSGITIAELDSVRMNFLYLNDGAVSTPAFTFNSDIDTGLYRIAADSIGIACGGVKIIEIAGTTTEITNELKLLGGIRHNLEVNATTSIALDGTSEIVEISSTSTVTVTLPNCDSTQLGREYTLIKTGALGTINVNTFDSNDHIDGDSITTIAISSQFTKITLISNGVNRWYVV